MPRIEKQALVDQDLIEIWLYTFDKWGENQADKYLNDLDEAIHLLAEQPLLVGSATNSVLRYGYINTPIT